MLVLHSQRAQQPQSRRAAPRVACKVVFRVNGLLPLDVQTKSTNLAAFQTFFHGIIVQQPACGEEPSSLTAPLATKRTEKRSSSWQHGRPFL